MANKTLEGKPYTGNAHMRREEAKVTSVKSRHRSLFSVIGLVLTLFLCVNSLWGASTGEKLLDKVWIPDPSGLKRIQPCPHESSFDNPWLEPSRDALPLPVMMETLFEPVACWSPSGGRYAENYPMFAVRVLNDKDRNILFSQGQFLVKVREILGRSTSVQRVRFAKQSENTMRKKSPKKMLDILGEYCSLTNDAATIVVTLESSNHLDNVEIVSKRYLNVDGRFLCLAVRDFVDDGTEKVKAQAGRHVAWLEQWERAIRRCTREHRLKECGGDETKMAAAIAQEIVQSKQIQLEKELRERERKSAELKGGKSERSDKHRGERVSIFDGFKGEGKIHGHYRGLGGLIAMALDGNGISSGWVLGLIATWVALIVVILLVFIQRDWRCREEPSDCIVDVDGVKEGLFTCVECGSVRRNDDAVLVRIHGNRRTVQVSAKETIDIETVAKTRVPICSVCEKVFYDRVGSHNRICLFAMIGIFVAAVIGFYLLRYTFLSSLFLGVLTVLVLGILFLIIRGVWPGAFGVDADAYFMRVEGLRKLKIALGFRVGKSRAKIQQQIEGSKENSPETTSPGASE